MSYFASTNCSNTMKMTRIIKSTLFLIILVLIGLGAASFDSSILKIGIIDSFIGVINRIIFWPLFALGVRQGSRLDTWWFLISASLTVLFVWSSIFEILYSIFLKYKAKNQVKPKRSNGATH